MCMACRKLEHFAVSCFGGADVVRIGLCSWCCFLPASKAFQRQNERNADRSKSFIGRLDDQKADDASYCDALIRQTP
jgi:hypothetical protein